jgi:phosphoglycolate phosphatase
MYLMFDLDGTLTDSRAGITRCIQHALAEAGVAAPPAEELTRYVGPPLAGSFEMLLGTSDAQRIEAAIAAYRRRFEHVGMFENCLYPGIAEMLASFRAASHELCVVTVKPRVYALRILAHFGIAGLFQGVYGPELGARHYSKASLIHEACAKTSTLTAGLMIGDRAEDVHGAKSNGVGSAAVTWGYGAREELEAAQPDCIVASTRELLEYVRHAVARNLWESV